MRLGCQYIAYLIEKLSIEKMFEIYRYKNNGTDIHNVKAGLANIIKINPYEWSEVEMISNKIYVGDVPRIIREAVENYNKNEVFRKRKKLAFLKDFAVNIIY